MVISFKAFRIHQGPADNPKAGQDFYVAILPAGVVAARAEVDAIDPITNPDGYQRRPDIARQRLVAQYVRSEAGLLPTNVLLSIRNPDALRFTKEGGNGLSQFGTAELDDDEVEYVIDGQHRVGGLKKAIADAQKEVDAGSETAKAALEALKEYPLPVCIFHVDERFVEMETFYIVNNKQKGVPTDVVDELLLQQRQARHGVHSLSANEMRRSKAVEVTHSLATNAGQPWKGRLLLANQDSQKGHYQLKQHAMVVSLEPVLRHTYVEALKDAPRIAELVGNFWTALRNLMPQAFGQPEDYFVMKTPGVYAWHLALPQVIEHLRGGRDFSVEAFTKVLRQADPWVRDNTWHKTDGDRLTWGSSMKSIRLLAEEIKDSLPALAIE